MNEKQKRDVKNDIDNLRRMRLHLERIESSRKVIKAYAAVQAAEKALNDLLK